MTAMLGKTSLAASDLIAPSLLDAILHQHRFLTCLATSILIFVTLKSSGSGQRLLG